MKMKFEFFPNEILLFCFEYFNIFELFSIFDLLNLRFSQLIRRISLQLNFQYIPKHIFDEFCLHLSFYPEIKQQIYSLYLSNKDTPGQIERFLTLFPLQDFSHLQFLTLTDTDHENVLQLTSMLPLTSPLRSLHMYHIDNDQEIFKILPMLNLQRLSILSFHSIQKRIDDTFNIIKLTLLSCLIDDLFYHLFDYFPRLIFLHIRFVSPYNYPLEREIPSKKSQGIHLKQLIIDLFNYDFYEFEIFAKQIPNLQNLSINSKRNHHMVDAHLWENLIQTSLIHLKTFKFKFTCDHHYLRRFESFQSEFWWKKHQWYVEYSSDKYLANVYTIPYLSNRMKIDFGTKRYPGKMISNVFDQVSNVTLNHEIIDENCQYYFSKIHTLELLVHGWNVLQPIKVENLRKIINLHNLKHLNISQYGRILTCEFILDLLKDSPNLSWITINPEDFLVLLENHELCQYLNRMIRKIDMLKYGYPSFKSLEDLKKFCEIFSNIEQLICYVMELDDVFILLNQLKKLSTIDICFPGTMNRESCVKLFEEQAEKFNYIFHIEGFDMKAPKLSIWIGKRMK